MIRMLFLLFSFGAFASIKIIPDFYNILEGASVESVEHILTDVQLQKVNHILDVIRKDQAEASKLTEEMLTELGFQFERLNENPPYNFSITQIPQKYFFKDYLDKVLNLKGKITLVFDEPLGQLTSRATSEGIWLDPQRFLIALDKPLAVVPHEAMHFVHINELREGKTSPYNSSISAKEPLLAIYKEGFLMDEIEAHLGDARLMKHRGKIFGESNLDENGKAALVFMMLTQVRTALDFIDMSLKADAEGYIKNFTRAQIDEEQFSFPITSILLVYMDKNNEPMLLQFISEAKPEDVNAKKIEEILLKHQTWVKETFEKLSTEFGMNNFELAEKTLREQAGSLIK